MVNEASIIVKTRDEIEARFEVMEKLLNRNQKFVFVSCQDNHF